MAGRGTGLAAVRPEEAVALAEALDPSPMGRRPARADERVRGGCRQLGWSPPLCPSHIIAALGLGLQVTSLGKPCLTPQVWGSGPRCGSHATHCCTTFIGCSLCARPLAERSQCMTSCNSPDLCDETEAE